MSVMAARELTRADLDALPDDGLRHELIDGAFVMTPAPGLPHQTLAFALARALHTASRGTELRVVMAPFDVVLGTNVVEPDILVAPRASFTERDLPTAPLLVVEVRSRSTARIDEVRKRSLYEEARVTHYWLGHPRPGLASSMPRGKNETVREESPWQEAGDAPGKLCIESPARASRSMSGPRTCKRRVARFCRPRISS